MMKLRGNASHGCFYFFQIISDGGYSLTERNAVGGRKGSSRNGGLMGGGLDSLADEFFQPGVGLDGGGVFLTKTALHD